MPRFPAFLLLLALAGCRSAGTPPPGDAAPAPPGTFAGLPEAPRATASSAFWDGWGDGRAELASYRATVQRYGAPRQAELVLIYVTEPHDRRTWIKDDAAAAPYRVPVLKLNTSLKFLTGIYPYSVMMSTFAPVDDWGGERFSPVKITLSVQEWCGMYTQHLWPGPEAAFSTRLSYFAEEGETSQRLDTGAGVLYEDALPIQLRELDGAFAGGGDWAGRLVPSLLAERFAHTPLEAVPARITRETAQEGGLPVTRFTLTLDLPGRDAPYTRTFVVEQGGARRLLGWTTSLGDAATLVHSERLPYWQLNGPDGVRYRAPFGLDTTAAAVR